MAIQQTHTYAHSYFISFAQLMKIDVRFTAVDIYEPKIERQTENNDRLVGLARDNRTFPCIHVAGHLIFERNAVYFTIHCHTSLSATQTYKSSN